MTRHQPVPSNTKLVFDYGFKSDYSTTQKSSYTQKQHSHTLRACQPHLTKLAPFGVHHKNAKVGLTTARPNYHHRLAVAKGAIPGNNLNALSYEKEVVPDISQFEDKIITASTGSRFIHSKNLRDEYAKHEPAKTSAQITKPPKEAEDYADYVYPDDLSSYRLLQLEAEEDEVHPKPPAPGSIKPKPFHGIRKLVRHAPKDVKFEPAKPAPVQRTDHDIISHLPRPQVKASLAKPEKLSRAIVVKRDSEVESKDNRRKITILLPGNEQYKRHGTRTFMDE